MSKKKNIAPDILEGKMPILEILNASAICFTIKNKAFEYVYLSDKFCNCFGVESIAKSDFDVFTDKVAFEVYQDDSIVFTSQLKKEDKSILISKKGQEIVAKITRSIVVLDSEEYLVSLLEDVTQKVQENQFKAYKRILTDSEIFEKMLNRFSTLIFDSSTEKEIFEGVGNLCLELLDLEELTFLLADHPKNELKLVLVVNRSSGIDYKKNRFGSIPLDQGITGRCARLQKTMLVEDVSYDPDYLEESSISKSEIAVPIVYKNQLIGVIDSESTELGRYNQKIKKTLEGIASLLAIKLNELQGYRQLELKNAELKSLIANHPSAIAMMDKKGKYL